MSATQRAVVLLTLALLSLIGVVIAFVLQAQGHLHGALIALWCVTVLLQIECRVGRR